ncbi:MAG: hypothetical protein MJ162_03735 [Treponema sp.]|nr:hypothetical protein [Treponema sp.]
MITGFPSPAQGYEDKIIDLNTLVVKHPAATVFMQVDTKRYVRYGIYYGDLLVVDRSLTVKEDSFVVFEQDGEFHIGWIRNLMREAVICGVITHVLHCVKTSVNSD